MEASFLFYVEENEANQATCIDLIQIGGSKPTQEIRTVYGIKNIISPEAHECLWLLIRYSGCGLSEMDDPRYYECVGVCGMDSLPLNSIDKTYNHMTGWLNVPVIINLIGQDSFASNEL
eukprot:9877550-Ditylum_brightwellii.AAC.1